MCIALVATSHPKYALIVLDNRDEYVLRPTSRPHWWTHQPSGNQILSSRDLLRRERGTWMGVSEQGRLAVLTNYREIVDDLEHPTYGVKSRGGMVTAWLGAPADETLNQFITKMLDARAVKGVGGFSLICGDLKRKGEKSIEPLVIISNRSEAIDGVPRIGGERDQVWGLSNTIYEDPPTWTKIKTGKKLLEEAIRQAVAKDATEDQLADLLFSLVLNNDTMPPRSAGQEHEEYLNSLRESVFIPGISDEGRKRDMDEAIAAGKMKAAFNEIEDESRETADLKLANGPTIFEKGAYGTQRQTVVLVDWEGQVTYIERALWDAHGNPVQCGKGDSITKFKIDGWK
ncbi:NRDE protein-domain-containing protein [Xylariales sp. AK1849]|nr:NRDE protein-domain-containing protein [Xylariales sp. AK1849]